MSKFLHGRPLTDQNVIVALDPGETTGLCIIRVNKSEDVIEIMELAEFKSDQYFSQLFSLDHIMQQHICVVFEKFQLIAANVSSTPLKRIGVIEFITRSFNLCTFSQVPSDRVVAGKVFKDDVDKYKSHHKDALMHALRFAIQEMHISHKAKIIHTAKPIFLD